MLVNTNVILSLRQFICMRSRVVLTILATSLSFVQFASAHGGEESTGPSNMQILMISAATSIGFFILFSMVKKYEKIVARSQLYSLVLFTATVHILLGINDSLLIIGGVGAVSAAFLPMVSNFSERTYQIADLALALIVISMITGYFVYNHDLHYILEDYLGIVTKLVELSVLFILAKQHVFTERKTED